MMDRAEEKEIIKGVEDVKNRSNPKKAEDVKRGQRLELSCFKQRIIICQKKMNLA